MFVAFLQRHRLVVSLIIVALWLGWTGMGLALLGKRSAADPAALLTALELIPASMREQKRPTAVLLTARCPCAPDLTPWSAIDQVMKAQGGAVFTLPSTDPASSIEMLVFDATGKPVYSGPLSPPPGTCGPTPADPGTWLPALIDGRQPPLHLGSSPCNC